MSESNSSSTSQEKPSGGPVGSGNYTVKEGDCLSSIAYKAGHVWETIWNDPSNSELKSKRKDPNVILAGDRLFIPKLRLKEEARGTDAKHVFEKKGAPIKLRLRFLTDDDPRANEKFEVAVDGAKVGEGTLDGDGRLEVSIPPDGKVAVVHIGEGASLSTHVLQLGGVDPVNEITGIQHRLSNLGYSCQPTGELDDDTREAISRFQKAAGLTVTGEPDENLKSALVKSHGC